MPSNYTVAPLTRFVETKSADVVQTKEFLLRLVVSHKRRLPGLANAERARDDGFIGMVSFELLVVGSTDYRFWSLHFDALKIPYQALDIYNN